jgi:hypothetical protein
MSVLLVFIDSTRFLSEYYVGTVDHVVGQDTAAQRIWLEKTLGGKHPLMLNVNLF